MQIDKAPEGGKFRAVAAAALNGVAGAWGNGDMLCVQFNAAGELILAAAGDNCEGVIVTTEGRKTSSPALAADKEVIGGRMYTMFKFAEFTEAELSTGPVLAAGDALYATALGDVTTAPAAADVYVGIVLFGGSRFILNINGRPQA